MKYKIVFCWSDISGYMAASWRALHQFPDIEVFVVAFQARTQTAFADELMSGIPSRLLSLEERENEALIETIVKQAQPDVIVLCGWFHPPYRKLASATAFKNCAFFMGMDTPWWGTWKQKLAPLLLRKFLKKIDRVVVTGERSWQYAYRLGIPLAKIRRGMYGIDYQNWFPLWEARQNNTWARSLLFVGRYTQEKGVDILINAYQQYREQVSEPWSLICCGKGELETQLNHHSSIQNLGFVQPDKMQTIWQNAGAFVLPSRFDPWPLALVEAAASGLPVICTDACGSAVEVIRSGYNGVIVPPNNVQALAQAFVTIDKNHTSLPQWGKRAQQFAAPYDANIWAQHWREWCKELEI